MTKSKIILCAAIGTAAALILAGCKSAMVRDYVSDGAKKWKKKLKKLASETGGELSDLRSMVSNRIEGLGDEARSAIMDILDKSTETAGRIQNKAKNAM